MRQVKSELSSTARKQRMDLKRVALGVMMAAGAAVYGSHAAAQQDRPTTAPARVSTRGPW
jgi:hypothetical protein